MMVCSTSLPAARIRSTSGTCSAGVASSCSPLMTNVGTRMSSSRSVEDQSLIEPMTWNSEGPFIVW